MKVALYCRKSTEDERTSEDGKSTARQAELARAFAVKHGWSVIAEYVDEGISGAEFANRPGFASLIADAKRRNPRPFDAVVAMALNRFGRDQVRVMSALTEIHESGVAVWTYQTGREVKLSNPTEILMASVEDRKSTRLNSSH